jgi:hypothetical protein
MHMEQRMAELAESLHEMVSTARAIHGDAFAQAVAMLFEIQSVVELHGVALANLPEERQPAYMNPMLKLTESLCGWVQLTTGLDQDKFNEAVKLSEQMADRQEGVHRHILEGQRR